MQRSNVKGPQEMSDHDGTPISTLYLASNARETLGGGRVQDQPSLNLRNAEKLPETSYLDVKVSRLKVLNSYLDVLDCEHENRFERLVALASRIFSAPLALMTIADLDNQYCLSSRGFDYSKTRRSPFCSQAIMTDSDVLVVEDAASDPRFEADSQVTEYPNVRFYAGAPLVCPEGYRIGTLCVMDYEPRFDRVSLEEKQSLVELAAMAMETVVDLLHKKQSSLKDPSRQIACTAHDLLTPLMGIILSLSLLKEDVPLQEKLSDQQKDMIDTAVDCSTIMNKVCCKTLVSFRDETNQKDAATLPRHGIFNKDGPSIVKIADLVKTLNAVIAPFPKCVPVIIDVESSAPPAFVSDDMRIFRSATNFLTNACSKTETGSIRLRVFARRNREKESELVFECEDTGPGIDSANYATLFQSAHDETKAMVQSGQHLIGLGLYSVATQIGSLGGGYGYRPRALIGEDSSNENGTGSVFWFSIPLILPSPDDDILSAMTEQPSSSTYGDSKSAAASETVVDPTFEETVPVRPPSGGLGKVASFDALPKHFATAQHNLENKRSNTSNSSGRTKKALVVEDSLVVRKILTRVLSNLGYEVNQALNGLEGLKELKASLFDIVLCDFLMPVMDGLDCVQQYREWEKVNRPHFHQHIVGISAHATEKDVQQAFKIGMSDFRAKPVTYTQIEELKNGEKSKRTSAELDGLCLQIQSMKRTRIDPTASLVDDLMHPTSRRFCLVVAETSDISEVVTVASETIGWEIVTSNDAESALGLLKTRNWDAVLVDDTLGRSRCISRFRLWEQENRVNRQKNIIFLSAEYVAPRENENSFHVPTEFDGALGKPIELNALQSFLEKAKSTCDIVTR
jgi:CheY-like chemotaxis protein